MLGSNAEWEEIRQKAATINLGMITFFTFLNTFPVALLSAVPDPTDDALSYDILTGVRKWRLQHPHATLREIEQALDER